MKKTENIPCYMDECRARLGNVGINYSHLGGDVYKFNSVQKKGEAFYFYATATLRSVSDGTTDVTVELAPDPSSPFEPADVDSVYEQFCSEFFRHLSQPARSSFGAFAGNGGQPSYAPTGGVKYCSRCGAELDKNATVCPNCGYSVAYKSSLLGIFAIVFSVLGGWIGMIMAVCGLAFYYKGGDPSCEKGRSRCKVALIIFAAWFVFFVIFGMV